MEENTRVQDSREREDMEEEARLRQEEQQFEAELAELMRPDPSGKKKKKEKREKNEEKQTRSQKL